MKSSTNYIIVVLLVVVATLSAVVYVQSRDSGSDVVIVDTTNTTELSAEQASILANNISQLIMVPNEAPSFSVVLDAANLRAEQSFYARVENGDVIAVYPENRLALLYRPSENILVNVGPLYLEQAVDVAADTATTSAQ